MYIMLLAHSLCPRHIFKCKLGCDSGDAKGAVRRPSEPSPRGTPPSRPRRTYSLFAAAEQPELIVLYIGR